MSQKAQVLDYLRSGRIISHRKADAEFGITRLAAHIHQLRKDGWHIVKRTATSFAGRRYAEYYMPQRVRPVQLKMPSF